MTPKIRLTIDIAVVLYEITDKDIPYTTRKQLITAQPNVISNRMNLFILIEIKLGCFLVRKIDTKKDNRGRIFKRNPKFITSNMQD